MALSTDPGITHDELQLAARNHGMPLEALRWPVTPVGLHYLLIHYDVPDVDGAVWGLRVRGERELSLGLGGHAAPAAARGSRRARRRGRGAAHRPGPGDRGRGGAGIPALAAARGGAPRRGTARVRDERLAAAAAARLPAQAGRPGLVRDDEREV